MSDIDLQQSFDRVVIGIASAIHLYSNSLGYNDEARKTFDTAFDGISRILLSEGVQSAPLFKVLHEHVGVGSMARLSRLRDAFHNETPEIGGWDEIVSAHASHETYKDMCLLEKEMFQKVGRKCALA